MLQSLGLKASLFLLQLFVIMAKGCNFVVILEQ